MMAKTTKRDHYHAITKIGSRRVRDFRGNKMRGHVRVCTLSCGHQDEWNKGNRSKGFAFCFDCFYGKCAECLSTTCVCDEGPTLCTAECCSAEVVRGRGLRRRAAEMEAQAQADDEQRWASAARHLRNEG